MATGLMDYNGVRIEEVQNGFIVHTSDGRYVFSSLKAALKAIEQAFKKRQ